MSQRIPLDCLWFNFEFSFVCCSYFLFSFQSILWLSGILFFVLFIFMHTARNDVQSELIDRAHALNTNFVSSFFLLLKFISHLSITILIVRTHNRLLLSDFFLSQFWQCIKYTHSHTNLKHTQDNNLSKSIFILIECVFFFQRFIFHLIDKLAFVYNHCCYK